MALPMRSFTYISIILLCLGIASCNWNRQEKAMKLTGKITAINDSLYRFGKIWLDEFKIAVNSKNFSELQPLRQNLEQFIDRNIVFIDNMDDVGNSEPIRKAELDILQFEKTTVLPKFLVFETFDTTTTDEQITEAYKGMMMTTSQEQEKLNKLYSLIDAYADKYEFPKPIE